MATLYITEYAAITKDAGGNIVPVAKEPAVASQTVTTSGTAAASAAFNKDTAFIRVISTAKEHLAFGASPTATTSYGYIPADTPEYFAVTAGQKLSAING